MTLRSNKSGFIPNAAAEVKTCTHLGVLTKIAKLSYLALSCFSGCLMVDMG
jgi:hypothetical protein